MNFVHFQLILEFFRCFQIKFHQHVNNTNFFSQKRSSLVFYPNCFFLFAASFAYKKNSEHEFQKGKCTLLRAYFQYKRSKGARGTFN